MVLDMRDKVACITGANSGIGFSVAKALAERNAAVHMVCRNQARGEEARSRVLAETGNENVYLHILDVSDFRQVKAFASTFVASNPRLNILVNNAGGIPAERTLSAQGNEAIMATMVGGTHLLTKLLLPSLEAAAATAAVTDENGSEPTSSGPGSEPATGGTGSRNLLGEARVINVSSGGMYSVSPKGVAADLNSVGVEPYDGTLIYAAAKRVQVILTERWAALAGGDGTKAQGDETSHPGKGVTFNSMHPGWVDTPGLASGMPNFRESRGETTLRSSEEGADTVVWLACSKAAAEETGKFWFDRKPRRTHMPLSGTKLSEADRDALWNAVEQYCGD